MRVLLLTQYYAPEPVDKFADLARGLRERGHQVEVITSFPCYPHGKTYVGYRQSMFHVKLLDGTRVIRVPQFPDHSRSIWRRALYYLSFALSAATIGLCRSRKADVLLVYQSALPVGLAAWWISRIKRIPYVLDVADLWPESVAASGMITNRAVLAIIRRVAKFIYRHAAAINVITEGYLEHLRHLGVHEKKLRLIHSWPAANHVHVEPAGEDFGRAEGLTGRFNILYAGAIGPCQQLETVLAAAALLQDLPNLQFILAGEGTERERLQRQASAACLSNVRFDGWRTPQDVARLAAHCELLLVHLKPDAMSKISIPSKTFVCMASGRPLLMAVEGEAAQLVQLHACGITAPPSDPQAMADAIRRFSALPATTRAEMGAAARRAYEEHYSAAVQIDKVVDSLTQIGSQNHRDDAAKSTQGSTPTRFYASRGKRILDIAIAAPALVLALPIMALTAVAVRLKLGSPVLFRQIRPGLHGEPFQLIKFRTMTDRRDADGKTLPDAERLTRFGKFLRASSLDELPQLWNVLRGHMSLVGPRPLLAEYLTHYTPEHSRRHNVRPGITGLAQVRGRNKISWNRRLKYDAWYAKHVSLGLDFRILMATAWSVVGRRNVSAEGHATMHRFDELSSDQINVIGAGGHGKVVIRAAQTCGLSVAGVFDDDPAKHGQLICGVKVLGPYSARQGSTALPAIIAIGDNYCRAAIASESSLHWKTLVHPRAHVDQSARLGAGAVVLAGAVVQVDSTIGAHAIINDNATIEHDCVVGDAAHVAPGACLAGGAVVGDRALIGAGAIILPGVKVGSDAIIGAGAVVVRDIQAGATAVGVPARIIKSLSKSSGRAA